MDELVQVGKGLPYTVVSGKTVCTNDFYEGKLKSTAIGQKPTFYPEITKNWMFEKCEFWEK